MSLSNFGDFTTKLTGKDVMIFSDSEGYLPTGIKTKIIEHLTDQENNAVIFNGDAADYTSRLLDTSKSERFFFLKLIKMVNDKPNFFATLGNRDLNKLILWQLVQRLDKVTWWKQKDESRTGIDYILNIAHKLYTDMKSEQRPEWLVENLESFLPYWSASTDAIKTWKGWDSRTLPLTLHNRYLAIFGKDPTNGTMTAENNIKGLFVELGITNEKLQSVNIPLTIEDQEFGAAFVFTVYARILDKNLANPSNSRWEYDGCLYKYLTTNPLIGYATSSSAVYLFSHGGVHSSFKDKLIDEMKAKYETSATKLYNGSIQQIIQKANDGNFVGGSIISVENIPSFNMKVIEHIKKYYDEVSISPARTQNINLQILNGLACPIGNHALFKMPPASAILYHHQSPIMAGMQSMIKDTGKLFTNEARPIFNIFGHSALGAGNLFAKTKTQTLVCSDFSNTFTNSEPLIGKTIYDENSLTLYLDMKTGEFKLDGEMSFLKLLKADNYNDTKKADMPTKDGTSKKIDTFRIFNEKLEELDPSKSPFKIRFDKNEPVDVSIKYQPKEEDKDTNQSELQVYYNGSGYISALPVSKETRINLFSTQADRAKGFTYNIIVTNAEITTGGYKKTKKSKKSKKSKQIKKSVKTRKINLVKNKKKSKK
jgi:hypothetical protein